jgi:hypothetical protein
MTAPLPTENRSSAPPAPEAPAPHRGPLAILQRVVLGTSTILVGVNVWSGIPLVSLWVGSRFANGQLLSMSGVVAVLLVLTVLEFTAVWLLGWLSSHYDHVTGRPAPPREQAPWMQSLRGERAEYVRRRRGTNAVESIIVVTVVVGFVAFEVWFFFFAHLSLPS